jgi:hypothetical protein
MKWNNKREEKKNIYKICLFLSQLFVLVFLSFFFGGEEKKRKRTKVINHIYSQKRELKERRHIVRNKNRDHFSIPIRKKGSTSVKMFVSFLFF